MSRLHVKSDYILQCSCSSAFFHPLFSYCCSPEVTCLQPACEEGAAAPFLSQEMHPHLQRQQ